MDALDFDDMTRRIDSLVITAGSVPELHRKLNTLTTNGSKDWQLLRSPVWRDGRLIAVTWKPSRENEK